MKRQQQLIAQVQCSQSELDIAQKKALEIDALVQENNRREEEEIKPSRIEIDNILKENETIAKSISALHEEEASRQKMLQETKKNNEDSLHRILKDIVTKQDYLNTKEESIMKLEQEISRTKETTQREIEEHEKFKASFDEAIAAQEAKITDEKERLKNERDKKVQSMEKELETITNEAGFKLQVYKRGVELITMAEDIEKKLSKLDGETAREEYASIRRFVENNFAD